MRKEQKGTTMTRGEERRGACETEDERERKTRRPRQFSPCVKPDPERPRRVLQHNCLQSLEPEFISSSIYYLREIDVGTFCTCFLFSSFFLDLLVLVLSRLSMDACMHLCDIKFVSGVLQASKQEKNKEKGWPGCQLGGTVFL